jgi:outer membrane receptor protein involved in Fe transport
VTLQQQFADHIMGYLTYARGYSLAAYNTSQALTPTEPTLGKVQQENIDHFELGTKGTYFDNRMTLNLALFDTKYKTSKSRSSINRMSPSIRRSSWPTPAVRQRAASSSRRRLPQLR